MVVCNKEFGWSFGSGLFFYYAAVNEFNGASLTTTAATIVTEESIAAMQPIFTIATEPSNDCYGGTLFSLHIVLSISISISSL
jgi:hypothetical protein